MKTLRLLAFVLSGIVLFSCKEKTHNEQYDSTSKTDRIEVIDFYGTHRCTACIAIENNTKYTLEKYFPDELKSGKLVFKTVNFDDEKNEAQVTYFGAYGTSLFISTIKDGKETHIDLSDFAFTKAENRDVFAKELAKRIKKELEKL